MILPMTTAGWRINGDCIEDALGRTIAIIVDDSAVPAIESLLYPYGLHNEGALDDI